MANKTIDELAVELTVAMLEHNSKLRHSNGQSSVGPMNAQIISNNFYYFRQVILGEIDPTAKNETQKD